MVKLMEGYKKCNDFYVNFEKYFYDGISTFFTLLSENKI